jgi:hypothetical protein
MKHARPIQIDFTGWEDERSLKRLAADIEAGIKRFWNKRGGDPERTLWARRRKS